MTNEVSKHEEPQPELHPLWLTLADNDMSAEDLEALPFVRDRARSKCCPLRAAQNRYAAAAVRARYCPLAAIGLTGKRQADIHYFMF